jgi:DNA-binding transcriptional MocR family regulator
MSLSDAGPRSLANLYEQVAANVARLIDQGTFRPGDRIPSVRQLSQQLKVSITTTLGAYRLLESQGVIEARPQSGYFVRARAHHPEEPEISQPETEATEVSSAELVMKVIRDTRNSNLVQLGAAIPSPDLQPSAKLRRATAAVARLHRGRSTYEVPPGDKALRAQIARRALTMGCTLTPDEILITSGAQEAVFLALLSLCKAGDAVATESPTYYGILQAIEALRLKVVEIPTHPRDGISLPDLRHALDRTPIKAVVSVSNFHNPLGSCMPEARKRELVEMLEQRDIPLIEDDLYGDLVHAGPRPSVAKAFDRKGQVLLCSSFSKTLAPGYRVGWIAPGRFFTAMERFKFVTNIAAPTLSQMAIAEFLADGGYDHYLRHVRPIYAQQVKDMARTVAAHFPRGTRVTRPQGGFLLWVELPEEVDSLRLYERARKAGMTIAPGPIFSAKRRYRNFIRLNCASWSDEIQAAVVRLGMLTAEVAGEEHVQ